MTTLVRVKPAEGLTVLNPDRDMRPLDPKGEEVPRSMYWLRRLRDGDVVEITGEPEPAKTKSKA